MFQAPLFDRFRNPSLPKLFREPYTLDADGLIVSVRRKSIRTLRLSVRPSDGAALVSAPLRIPDKAIRAFVITRRRWIEVQRRRLDDLKARGGPRYQEGESLPLWGGAVTLRLRVRGKTARAELVEPGVLELRHPEGAALPQREAAVKRWYARQLLEAARALLPRRQEAMGVRVEALRVRAMRSRWGSCNARNGVITLALDLARRGPESLDYVLTHELAHLITRGHGKRFKKILDRRLPDWRERRKRLNREPPLESLPPAKPAYPLNSEA